MIEYRGIHKSFDFPVLTGVDLTVATGETSRSSVPRAAARACSSRRPSGSWSPTAAAAVSLRELEAMAPP
jgi:hypothetical protein